MSKDHIIPRFILKGFAKNPTANEANQKVLILNTETFNVSTVKISDAFAIQNFNTEETEKFLAYQYEDGVAKIFHRIKRKAENGENNVTLNNEEYKLLFRFFTIMWRRNSLHMNTARKMGNQFEDVMKSVFGESGYKNMLKPEYKDVSFDDLFQENQSELSKIFYDNIITNTNDDDPTVQKTIRFYLPTIIHNKSNVHFTLHNSYATTRYFMPKGVFHTSESDVPSLIIEPISNNLCFCLALIDGEVDLAKKSFEIPIEIWERDDEIIQHFIEGYTQLKATNYVVDDTNIEIVKKIVQENATIKAQAESTAPPDQRMQFLEQLLRTNMKPLNPYEGFDIGRNAPCPCGSGKKYKYCCLDKYQ